MKFKFDIGRGDFARAVVWVYDRTDGGNVTTRFNGQTTDRTGTISWADPAGEYKARIIVYYTLDVVPPAGQDVWISNLPCSEDGIFEETVIVRSAETPDRHGGTEYKKTVSVTTTGGDLARWMEREKETIGGRQLRNVVLPGTHDSGSFDPKLGGATQTQDLTIGQQLKYGVRVLDFRVARARKGKDGLVAGRDYLHHNGYMQPSMNLEIAMQEIVDFAETHRGEIVILKLDAGTWCEDVNPLLPTLPSDQRWTRFTVAEAQAFRDYMVSLLRGRSGASLLYDRGTFRSSDRRALGRRTVDEIVASGRTIVVIGDDPSGQAWWSSSDNYWGTWNYVCWISSAGKTLDQRMYGKKVAVSEKVDGIPLDPDTDQKRWPSGDGEAPGFVETCGAVHRRRLACIASGDRRGDSLVDFGPNFATLDIVSAATVVAQQSIDWMIGWESDSATKGALNVVNLDFFTRAPFVPRVIRFNRARP